MEKLLTLIAASLLVGCGVETAGTAATVATLKAKEAQQAQESKEKLMQNLDDAQKQAEQRLKEAESK